MPAESTQRRYIALLAGIAAGILCLGTLLKPKKSPEPTVSQAEMLRLQRLTQRRNLENLSSYFSGIAKDVEPKLVWLDAVQQTGVPWKGGVVVTAGSERRPWGFPVATFPANDATPPPPQTRPSEQLEPGTWIVQVARQADGPNFAPGTYAGTGAVACGEFRYREVQSSLPLSPSAAGGGLFDMDGNLLAVVIRCGERIAAVTPASIDKALGWAKTFEGALRLRYGMSVTALDERARAYFKAEKGALVTDIWKDSAAEQAGLFPGDIIVAVGDRPVAGPEDLKPLLAEPSDRFELRLQRGRRMAAVKLPPEKSEESGPGFIFRDLQSGYLIEAVEPGSRADRASLRPGDRLLRAGGVALSSSSAARRALAGRNGAPTHVVVERGQRTLGVFLP